jgi:hypothetical protein
MKMNTCLIYINNIVFKWMSYDQFNDIKELSKSDLFILHNMEDTPLYYHNNEKKEYTRKKNRNVALTIYHIYKFKNGVLYMPLKI